METRLTLQDLLKINGIDPKDVLLIRHSLNHENFKKCYDSSDKGILGRWSEYVKSLHGGNIELIRLLEQYPDRYKKFQFSILQIFSKGASDSEIIEAESLYKEKLCSIEFGLNNN